MYLHSNYDTSFIQIYKDLIKKYFEIPRGHIGPQQGHMPSRETNKARR